MLLQRPLSVLALAVAASLPLGLHTTAAAQPQFQQSTPGISAFGVDQVERLRPGEVLAFRLDGTPDARVSLQISGASVPVQLSETSPGRYEGEYTIRQRDRFNAGTTVTARLMKNGQASSAMLSESLLEGGADPVAASTAQISAFQVNAPERVQAGDELAFSMTGTPGGQASVALQGVAKRIPLAEVRPGVYETTYVVRRSDRLRGAVVADAHLLSNRRETTLRYDAATNGKTNRDLPVANCANCGSVVAVKLATVDGDSPNVIGTIAGGLLGGVLGNQVGGGTGKDLATIAGALGGAYAGNRVQNSRDKKQVHRVSVRLDNGTNRSFDYEESPGLVVGARVKVENNLLARL